MTAAYRVDVDKTQLAEAISAFEFVGGNTDEALRIAINKTAPKIRTLSSVKIREQVRLSASYVRDKLTIRRATRSTLSASINTPKRGLLLTKFSTDATIASDGVRWIRPPLVGTSGIRVKVKPSGSTKTVSPGATGAKPFYIILKDSKALGIARRNSKNRNDIEVLHGPSLSQVFDDVREDVTPEASAELTRQMADAMRYILVKKYPPEPADD
jgi:hypothetical protein